jgi:hypothetical protein
MYDEIIDQARCEQDVVNTYTHWLTKMLDIVACAPTSEPSRYRVHVIAYG